MPSGTVTRSESASKKISGAGNAVTGDRVVAVVRDLFFMARIRETARLAGVPLVFARTLEELTAALTEPARFVLLDLTAGLDYAQIFAVVKGVSPKPPLLAFTTHALAATTKPLHGHCDRVVTKEILTRELPSLLKEGIAA